jgi:hypothetical protein
MNEKGPLLPQQKPLPQVSAADRISPDDSRTLATRDREVIRRWAERRHAEPATGIGTVDVNDGDAGVRFNFPGASPFHAISWEAWFADVEEHGLVFVFEETTGGGTLSNRYRLIKPDDWPGHLI